MSHTPSQSNHEVTAVGASVSLCGLKNRGDLNGLRGTVVSPGPDGRVRVKVWDTGEIVAIKPSNLRRGASGTRSTASAKRDGKHIKTGPSKAAEEAYRASKERRACIECGVSGVKLSVCSGCKMVYFCSKECQRKNWPSHKKRCRELRKPTLVKDVFEALDTHSATGRVWVEPKTLLEAFGEFPTVMLGVDKILTGHKKECLFMVPAWVYEGPSGPGSEAMRQIRLGDPEIAKQASASIVKSIRFFFKRERGGNPCFSDEDISHVCQDVLLALCLGLDGVREVTAEVNASGGGQDQWGPTFQHLEPIPDEWSLDERKLLASGLPPQVIQHWKKGIARVRARFNAIGV